MTNQDSLADVPIPQSMDRKEPRAIVDREIGASSMEPEKDIGFIGDNAEEKSKKKDKFPWFVSRDASRQLPKFEYYLPSARDLTQVCVLHQYYRKHMPVFH